jgi:hypothetical protein
MLRGVDTSYQLTPVNSVQTLKVNSGTTRKKQVPGEEQHYLRANFLSKQTLQMMERTCRQYESALVGRGLLPNRGTSGGRVKSGSSGQTAGSTSTDDANKHANNMALVKALLCASLYPNIAVVAPAPATKPRGGSGPPPLSTDFPLEFRTAELFGKKHVRNANGKLKDRAVQGARGFEHDFVLEDVIGCHACSLEASMRVSYSLSAVHCFLPGETVNYVATLKAPASVECVDQPTGTGCSGESSIGTGALAPTSIPLFRVFLFVPHHAYILALHPTINSGTPLHPTINSGTPLRPRHG